MCSRARALTGDATIYVLNGLFPGTSPAYLRHGLRPVLGSFEEIPPDAADLDAILVATCSPDHLFPATACLVQAAIATRKELGSNLGLFVMIRPRAGDFLYSDYDFDIMLRDTEIMFEAGADGFIFGVITQDGELDLPRMRELIKRCPGRKITLHRAFESVRSPERTLEQAADLGVHYVFTGGPPPYGRWGDNQIPDETMQDGLFETPATLNDTWGYKSFDQNWKSAEEVLRLKNHLNTRGINYLLNVGPDYLGRIPAPSQQILRQVGQALRK